MEEILRQLVANTSGPVAYAVVFGILMACGLGVPLPEDVSLILGGFLVFEERANLQLMMLTGFLGILMGDSLIFLAGRRLGTKVGKEGGGFFSRIVTPEKRKRVEGLFARNGEKIVMIARFMPGVRAVTYFTAGSAHMKYSRFIFFDGLAALVSAPAFVYLGYRFGGELETLINNVRKGQTRVLVGLAIAIGLYVLYSMWRRRQEQAKQAAAPQVDALPSPSEPAGAVPEPVKVEPPRGA
ncbi:MAG: DedA family protein [Myxococcaceae bacterium]|nr:DedA family protein [Myxococcaceae bacterium]